MNYLKVLLLLISITGNLYYLFSLYAAITFFKDEKKESKNFNPPVTILKPLCGIEWGIEENLESFCQQNYPEYQIIFSCQKSDDQVIPLVQKLISKYPHLDIDLVINNKAIGPNLKVCNLNNAIANAKHDILIIADSDIRVTSEYLNTVVSPLQNEKIGVVTCLYKSERQGLLTIFETLEIATHFTPRILTAKILEGVNFAFGSTTVIRRKILDEIGGFSGIVDYLADDYQLGFKPSEKGHEIVLSNYVVSHVLGKVKLPELLSRQHRWLMCIRVSRFWGYLGLIFTQGTFFSLLFSLIFFSKLGLLLLGLTLFNRIFTGYIIGGKFLGDETIKKYFLLIPFWDIISFFNWFYSLFGNKIIWRGKKFTLIKGGKLINS